MIKSVALNNGFRIAYSDLNHAFDLNSLGRWEQYSMSLPRASRKNYRRSVEEGLVFSECPYERFDEVYGVIEKNRAEKGFPLRMTREHLFGMLSLHGVSIRLFAIMDNTDIVASAVIFDVTETVSQVVYWGDMSAHRHKRPMALLAVSLVDYYRELGKTVLDVGPSSESGVVNEGLADFKRSIGCFEAEKVTLVWGTHA